VSSPLAVTDLDKYKAGGHPPDAEYPANIRTFYSPIDDVHGALNALIGSCRRSLVVAMYGYDDDEFAALIDGLLKDPAIYVQITLDSSQAGGVHEKALLAKYAHEMTGNSVAIGRSEKGAIMHRKMLLVDGIWRCTGSTNWSTSGESKQDNELTVLQSASACAEARTVLDIEHDSALQQMKAAAS
jgi:phosphatidylserine/phosphatidylglycerophosphate/cardiolipin synthase-like enzyme